MLNPQKLHFPLIDEESVQAQLRIETFGKGYRGYIQTDSSDVYRFPINLTQHDVDELNTELQQILEKVSSYFDTDDSASTERYDALSNLAQKGNFAFKRIFSKGMPRATISKALKKGATIQITTEDFFIPWELLYDAPLNVQLDAAYFWGMQYVVSRNLIRDYIRPGDFAPPIIPSCPRVGLIAYEGLLHVVQEEIPGLQKFQQQKQIDLVRLRSLDPDQHLKELEDFGRFLQGEQHIIHFACHTLSRKLLNDSPLVISDEFYITMNDFGVQEFEIEHSPLVILNACLTGTISPLYTSNWAELFWKLGAIGVLATEFHVPDWFAASFVIELYNELLAGIPLGEALSATRCKFWEKQGNPLGLAYALYSRPSIKVTN
jgi:hypothetical protein